MPSSGPGRATGPRPRTATPTMAGSLMRRQAPWDDAAVPRLTLEGTAMPDKGGDFGSKAVTTLAGAAAAFVARKVIIFAWTRATGKEPPGKAEDPDVAIGEALAWTVVLGIGVAVARMLAIRFATRQSAGRLPASEALR